MERRRLLIGSAIALVAASAIVFWIATHRGVPAAAPETAPQVATAVARDGTLDVTVDAVGRLGDAAGADSRLAFAVPGRIANVYVHVGEHVGAGEALAALDATGYTLAARQADADAVAARAQAASAGVDRFGTKIAFDDAALARAQRLYAAGVGARKDVEAARAALAADEADRRAASSSGVAAAAQAQSASAHAALAANDAGNTVLRAPNAGVVTAILHSVGESVDPTVPAIALAPAATGAIVLQVAAADAARVAPGDPVRLRTDAGASIAGRVAGVAGAVDPVTQAAQVSVRAAVPVGISGSALSGAIVVSRSRGTVVPYASIVADPQTGKTLVFVRSTGKDGAVTFEPREVRIVTSNAADALVAGVRPGERVAARGAFELLAPQGGGD